MAIKNIPLTISRPNLGLVAQPVAFAALAAQGDSFQIPFRYPFVDIANYAALETAGFFRHNKKQYPLPAGSAVKATSSELNPVGDAANANPQLGYQLPHTEKLVLLVQLTDTIATNPLTLTVQGSAQYRIPNQVITFAAATPAGIYEVPLFDFGLFIEVGTGTIDIAVDSTTGANEVLVKTALLVRSF
jgi:hypothetical protein